MLKKSLDKLFMTDENLFNLMSPKELEDIQKSLTSFIRDGALNKLESKKKVERKKLSFYF